MKGISQQALSVSSGISERTIRNIEKGQDSTTSTYVALAQVLNVDVFKLLDSEYGTKQSAEHYIAILNHHLEVVIISLDHIKQLLELINHK